MLLSYLRHPNLQDQIHGFIYSGTGRSSYTPRALGFLGHVGDGDVGAGERSPQEIKPTVDFGN
jgi:hypothetical protein